MSRSVRLTGLKLSKIICLDIAFAPYTEIWRELRKICVLELFSTKRVDSFRFIREEEVGFLINSISESTETPADVSEKIFALMAGIVFRMSFGKRFQGSDVDNEGFSGLVHEAEAVMGSFSGKECIPFVGWIIDMVNGHRGKMESVFRRLDSIFQQVIDVHLLKGNSGPEQKEDIVDVLLRLERDQIESNGDAWLTKNKIKAVLLNLFLGGVDTSAITVIWAMTELMRKPKLMKKVQDEVRNHTGKKESVTEDDLNNLQYLKMVIKETLVGNWFSTKAYGLTLDL